MPKRCADADGRRFFDEFESVRVSRFRATGVIDPAKRQALIPFPGGRVKLLGTAHTSLKYGGGWSYFICPKCARRAANLHLIDDMPLCRRCCNALNIHYRTQLGFGRHDRMRCRDKLLDELVAKVETGQPLRVKTPASWQGLARKVYNSRALKRSIRRRLIELRLDQIASQDSAKRAAKGHTITSHLPLADTKAIIDIEPIWRASSTERLQQALDQAQTNILNALTSPDPNIRLSATRLMLRTKQARDRGITDVCT